MVIAKLNCSQALVTDGRGRFVVIDTDTPWVETEVDPSPPDDEPSNVWPIRCQCHQRVA